MTAAFVVNVVYGSARVESRFVEEGGRLHGEGRRIDYDQSGRITNVGEWRRSGCSMGWDDGSPLTSKHVSALIV